MKNKFVLFFSTILISLIIVGSVYAFQIGNVDGVWGLIDNNADPGDPVDVIGVIGDYSAGPGGEDELYTRNSDVCAGVPNPTDFTGWTRTTTVVTGGFGSYSGCTTASSLFLSEYGYSTVFGTAAIAFEIYNGTGSPIDLSGYAVRLYTSDTDFTIIDLNDVSLADGDVFVVANNWAAFWGVDEDQTFGNNNAYRTVVLVEGYSPDTDPNQDDATCSNWATGPTGNDPNGTTGLTISTDWFDQLPPNTDFNQIRYGDPVNGDCDDFDEQSGMAFDGSDLQTPNPQFGEQVPFLLGKFCHINHTISTPANALNNIHNTMTISGIKCDPEALFADAEPTSLTFDYVVNLDETPNDQDPCPYGDTAPCADKIEAPQAPEQTFRCYYEGDVYVDYTVALVGFIALDNPTDGCSNELFDPDDVTGVFISDENATNCGCVFGMITDDQPTAVELLSFEASSHELGILLEWATASEVDNLGFNLYRSEDPYGPKTLINPELIPSLSPGGTAGAEYAFLDTTTIGGRQYNYWLEDIDSTSRTSLSGPASAVSGDASWQKFFLPVITTGISTSSH